MNKRKIMAGMLFFALTFIGCVTKNYTEVNGTDLPFSFVEEEQFPKDLRKQLEKKKHKPFRIVYSDMDYLYIAEGYGEKEYENGCIEIEKCVESENAIYIEMTLHGPGGEGRACNSRFPYCVIKMEFQDKPVIFED